MGAGRVEAPEPGVGAGGVKGEGAGRPRATPPRACRRHRPLDSPGGIVSLGSARMMRVAAPDVAAPSRSRRGSSMPNSRSRAARMRTAIRESRPSSAKAVAGVMRVGGVPGDGGDVVAEAGGDGDVVAVRHPWPAAAIRSRRPSGCRGSVQPLPRRGLLPPDGPPEAVPSGRHAATVVMVARPGSRPSAVTVTRPGSRPPAPRGSRRARGPLCPRRRPARPEPPAARPSTSAAHAASAARAGR